MRVPLLAPPLRSQPVGWLRERPWWQQALVWFLFWPILLLVLLWRSDLDERVKGGVTLVVVFGLVAAAIVDARESRDTEFVFTAPETPEAAEGATEDESTTTAVEETTTATEAPTTTQAPTTTVTEPPTQAELIEDAVADALGESNRDYEPRFTVTANPGLDIIVTWAISSNLTDGMTKDGARLEAVDILKAVREVATDYSGVRVEGTYPLVDQFGNSSEKRVVLASYSAETLSRFNWDQFNYKNIFEPNVADDVYLHPAFQY